MPGLELRIPPVVVGFVFAGGIGLVSAFVPLARVPLPGGILAAVAAMLAGTLVALAGVWQFRRAGTTVHPMTPERTSKVVSGGLYRWSRNPMYLGMALVLFGLAAWRSTLAGYALAALFCAYLTRFQILPEERVLLAAFGPEFAAYMARVRRWI
ncbi:MAG TPA: isoprenylcysteine carboxylmethyltransferase family protein [Planctomycetota bacterium]